MSASVFAAPPNILICISDDQSWEHTSAYGYKAINTPNFDRVARDGILFNNAFAPSPGCSPTRASLLTGRHIWQIENAGTHASSFPKKYVSYPDLLEKSGYFIGGTGKLWGPGNYEVSGRLRNPAGTAYSDITLKPPYQGINKWDYAANFEDFIKAGLKEKQAKQRAKEATKGVIDSIKWLDEMDVVIIVVDATKDPYTQVNITIIGNLQARNIPVLIVANKSDLKKADVKKVQAAYPQYNVIGISAKYGNNIDKFYEGLFAIAG